MTFEFDGEKYKNASAAQKSWGLRVIEELGLKGGETVLDLGAGDGYLTAEIAKKTPGGRVLGIDGSRSMINEALNHKAPNLEFVLMDINKLEFREEFDLIYSSATLHWIHDHVNLLNSCYEALKPGGRIRFNFAGQGNCPGFIKVVKDAMELDEFREAFRGFEWPWFFPGILEYTRIVSRTPFKKAEMWIEDAAKEFDKEGLVKWMEQPSLVPFLAALDKEQKVKFRDIVVENTLKTTLNKTGKYFMDFKRMNVKAEKIV